MDETKLPRLLYISDVPVEPTVGGATLIYRLLQNYPSSKLKVVEHDITASRPDKRLHGVSYETIKIGPKSLLSGVRFGSIYYLYLTLSAKFHTAELIKIAKEFQPEAILTVTHGLSWLRAAAVAEKMNLPLHLILHDDWSFSSSPVIRKIIDHQFGLVYKQAKSRLCVSPYMAENYEKMYGVKAQILYPSRAIDTPVFNQPPKQKSSASTPLTFGYAGSIHQQGYAKNLVLLASVLEKLGAKLIIYTPANQEAIKKSGLTQPNVTINPPIPSHDLIPTLRSQADVLFAPMSFAACDRPNMEISFPSKLTDYTATGLPLLIWGPKYCSAVRWAKENLGVAEVVDTEDMAELTVSVQKLVNDPEYRLYLSKQVIKVGDECFSHANAVGKLYAALQA